MGLTDRPLCGSETARRLPHDGQGAHGAPARERSRHGAPRATEPVWGRAPRNMDLSVQIGSLTLKNPLIAASGCFGPASSADAVDLASLSGIAVKGLFLAEREGHPPPRIVETPAGMLNAIGLQGIAVHRFIDEKPGAPRQRERP